MNVLLDTCTYVWYYSAPHELSDAARTRIADPATAVYLSVVNIWEVLVKQKTGRADAPPGDILRIAAEHIATGVVSLLPVEMAHAARLPGLPDHHRDPWDRMLVCQALAESLTILTPDKLIHQYPVAWEW